MKHVPEEESFANHLDRLAKRTKTLNDLQLDPYIIPVRMVQT